MRALILAIACVLPGLTLAHSIAGAEPSGGLEGEGFLIGLLVFSGAWYAFAFARLYTSARKGRSVYLRRGLMFAAGWSVIVASLLTPLHELGGRSFTAHMIEHELLMLVSAPLIAWSRPLGVLLWAFAPTRRRRLAAFSRKGWFSAAWSLVSAPGCASLLQAAMLWLWHAPPLFDRALRSEAWHAAQHLSLFFSALLFWWSLSRASAVKRQHGVAALWLFFTSMHSGLLGALMSFSESPWYQPYAQLALAGVANLTPMQDQQLAGLIMWIPGGALHAVVALIYLNRWFTAPAATSIMGPAGRCSS